MKIMITTRVWYNGAQKIVHMKKWTPPINQKILIKNFESFVIKNWMLLCLNDPNQPTAISEF